MIKKRNNNIDIIRCIAVFSVIAVHFFLNIGYYSIPIIGKKMYIMMLLRTTFMICIPLFLLMTGYLMNKKELSKKYYKGIIRVIVTYIVISIASLIFRKYYLNDPVNIFDAIFSILEFKACEYAWYIEMYIGLFMLIPFLNILWNNIKDIKAKRALIITFLLLTAAPSILNIFDFRVFGIILHSSNHLQKIVPEWWINIYPITYYFIGAYINDANIKIKPLKAFTYFLIAIILFGTYNYVRNFGQVYDTSHYAGWASIQNITMGVIVFLMILNLDLDGIVNKKIWNVILKISELSFGIYLSSFMVDRTIYPELLKLSGSPQNTLVYFIPTVLLVFTLSFLLSWLFNIITKFIIKIIDKIMNKNSI